MDEIGKILESASGCELHFSEELLPLVYDESRTLASERMSGQAPDQTLQAPAMRQILVKRAQAKASLKRRKNRFPY